MTYFVVLIWRFHFFRSVLWLKWPFYVNMSFKTICIYNVLLFTLFFVILAKDRITGVPSVSLTSEQSSSLTLVLPLINPPLRVHMFNTLWWIWEVPWQRFKTLWPQPFNPWPQLLPGNMSHPGDSVYFMWLEKKLISIKFWKHNLV